MQQSLLTQIAAMKTQIQTLQHDKAGLQMKVDQAQANQDHAVAGVQSQLDAANANATALQAKIDAEAALEDSTASDLASFLAAPVTPDPTTTPAVPTVASVTPPATTP